MHLLAIGDVGELDSMLHTGDEAMFEELVGQLRRRGATTVTGISANPADTAARYGIEAVERIGGWASGAGSVEANLRRQELVVALARRIASGDGAGPDAGTDSDSDPRAGLAADDPARALVAAVASADAVAIAGGGNLASTWPLHIWERGTLGLVAEALDRPLVVTGQTIGPELTEEDGERIATLLRSARLVGVREPASRALCVALGVPDDGSLVETIDDASFLGGDATTSASAGAALVSLSGHLGGADPELFVSRLAETLDGLAAAGLRVVFLPHFAPVETFVADGALDVRGDVRLHERVRAAMTAPSEHLPVGTSLEAAAAARSAELVITSRYHPAVFAAPAGVPIVAIAVDEYTTVKLTGATRRLGQDAVLPIEEVLEGAAPAIVVARLADAEAIRRTGRERAAERRIEASAWWDRIAQVLEIAEA